MTAIAWPLLAASLVVGLAALVRIVDPHAGAADDLTGVIRLPWGVTASIASLLTLAAVVFFFGLMRRMRSRRHGEDDLEGVRSETRPRQPWLQALSQILTLVNFLVIGYLLWKNVVPLDGLMGLGQGVGADGAFPKAAPDAPWLVTWSFAALAVIAAAGALVLALWFTSGDRLATWWAREDELPPPPPALVEAVDESADDLRTEPDARRAIIRCYARFERAAAVSGLARLPWQTPMEFMRETLARLPAPRGPVHALTSLFELARFSERALGPGERDQALDALDDIKGAINAGR